MIKYLGSKRRLVPRIVDIVGRIPDIRTACDLFTGTTRVAQALKRDLGLDVVANDVTSYSEVLAQCYVEADAAALDQGELRAKLDHLASVPGVDGYVTETFCRQARYFQPHNGMRIDAVRAEIDVIAADATERAILLTSLMEAADRVDSTTGVQMAYLKQWAPRSFNELDLRLPDLIAGPGRAVRGDAAVLAPTLAGAGIDLTYLDPPYNQHSYAGNYHIWETLVRNDAPEHYGVARKRVDVRTSRSDYNSRVRAWDTFAALVRSVETPWLLVSFSDEGFLKRAAIEELLSEHAETAVAPIGVRRYVGAQIGIHDHRGARVGEVSHVRNTEFLFLCGPNANEVLALPSEAATA
ncbi:MAG: DNA adenine methylase [Thermoleophilia bacterium]|nr:DNA adenine methylase [Thermoleophilia bacterium]